MHQSTIQASSLKGNRAAGAWGRAAKAGRGRRQRRQRGIACWRCTRSCTGRSCRRRTRRCSRRRSRRGTRRCTSSRGRRRRRLGLRRTVLTPGGPTSGDATSIAALSGAASICLTAGETVASVGRGLPDCPASTAGGVLATISIAGVVTDVAVHNLRRIEVLRDRASWSSGARLTALPADGTCDTSIASGRRTNHVCASGTGCATDVAAGGVCARERSLCLRGRSTTVASASASETVRRNLASSRAA